MILLNKFPNIVQTYLENFISFKENTFTYKVIHQSIVTQGTLIENTEVQIWLQYYLCLPDSLEFLNIAAVVAAAAGKVAFKQNK